MTSISELMQAGLTSIRSIEVVLGPSVHLRIRVTNDSENRLPQEAIVVFKGVTGLHIEDLPNVWHWNLSVVDISRRGLEDVAWKVTDPPMGLLSFLAQSFEIEVP